MEDEVLLLDPRAGRYYPLNRTASDVRRLADGELSLAETISKLAVAYGFGEGATAVAVAQAVPGFDDAGLLRQP